MAIGAYAIERDYSQYVSYLSKTIFAVVGTASKGPIGEATVCTSAQDLVNKFGPLKLGSYALYAGQYFLSQATKLYFVRAASSSAAEATTTVPGKNTSNTDVANAVVFKLHEKGTYGNGYKLTVTEVPSVYTIVLKDGNGTTKKIVKNVKIEDLTTTYSNTDFSVSGVVSGSTAVELTPGSYTFSGAEDSDDKASVDIKGKAVTTSGNTTTVSNVNDAVTLELTLTGTTGNGYRVIISKGDTFVDYSDRPTYRMTLRNASGVVSETKDVKFSDMTATYAASLFSVNSIQANLKSLTDGTYTFAGGNDGIDNITSSDYITAANALSANSVDMNLFAVPGISEADVIVAMLNLAETRGDCLYLVDPPQGLTRDGVVQWHNGTDEYEHSVFNSSYGALYYDWVTIYDSVNKQRVQVPPSVPVGASIAYSDRISELWYAPAGLNRGLIRGVLDSVTKLDRTDVEYIYNSNKNCVNAVYDDPQVGLMIWGQKTLYREDTALNRINVRRLMNYLKRVVVAACDYLVFEPNDRVTWNTFEMKIKPVLESIKNRRGIYEYQLVKGSAIVTNEDIDNYRMPCMIIIRPTKAAEEIPIYFVLTSTGADFNDVLEANGVATNS